MEKFNITKSSKRELAKLVKKAVGNNDYTELSIVYLAPSNIYEGRFDICGTSEKELIDSYERGECFYCRFEHSAADGKPTLKEIENKIFG